MRPSAIIRLRSNCAERFFRKILVPGNDRVFAKNVSQIFRQIWPIFRRPVVPKNLGNKFHFYEPLAFFKFEPIWKRLFSNWFVGDLQICCHFEHKTARPKSKQMVKTNTLPICFPKMFFSCQKYKKIQPTHWVFVRTSPKNLGNKFHFYEPIWKSFFQIGS